MTRSGGSHSDTAHPLTLPVLRTATHAFPCLACTHARGTHAFSVSADSGHAGVLSGHLAQVGPRAAPPNPHPFCPPPRSGFPGNFVRNKLKHILLLLSIDFMENKLPGPPNFPFRSDSEANITSSDPARASLAMFPKKFVSLLAGVCCR